MNQERKFEISADLPEGRDRPDLQGWPTALACAASFLGNCGLPTALYDPEAGILVSNEAWSCCFPASSCGTVERSVQRILEPEVRRSAAAGKGTFLKSQSVPAPSGEETFWNFSLTPISEQGKAVGVLAQANEITSAVINERRLSFQIQLADRLRGTDDPEQVKRDAATLLGEYLGAARVGFVEVDERNDRATVTAEWRRDEGVRQLKGGSTALSNLPAAATEYLRTGQVLALADVENFSRGGTEGDARLGEQLGTRAVITVPIVRDGVLRAMLFVHEQEPREWTRSEAAIARDVAERTSSAVKRAEAEQKLRASEDHYRHAVELNPQVSWTAGPDGQLNRVSRRWQDWTGTTGLGTSWADGLHPDDRDRTFAAWGRSVATGEVYDIEHRVQHLDGSYRWARSRAYPRLDERGDIVLWYGTTEDLHEKKVAEEHQRLLINELNHRVKNTLATVQAIAFQTLKRNVSVEEGRALFEARLMALSRAHNLLTESNWEGAELQRLVRDATEYLSSEGERFEFSGPGIWLAPRAALALSLALHELSTNAAKHGALSNGEGRVSITWAVEGDALRLKWKERNGPPVVEPASRGFGSRLVEKGLAGDLGGQARLTFEPDGLLCVIEGSLAAIQAREDGIE